MSTSPMQSRTRSPLATLRRAAAIVQSRRAVALRLPRDMQLAVILTIAGTPTLIDRDSGIAHIRADLTGWGAKS